MIIGDLYIVRAVCLPDETDAPLLVDADAVLPLSILLESLKHVSGRYAEVRE